MEFIKPNYIRKKSTRQIRKNNHIRYRGLIQQHFHFKIELNAMIIRLYVDHRYKNNNIIN